MDDIKLPEQYPVEVSAYVAEDRHRHVRVAPGGQPQWALCANKEQFEAHVDNHLSNVDYSDPQQVYWVDNPGKWSGL